MNATSMFDDPHGWVIEARIRSAVETAAAAGVVLQVPQNWREQDLSAALRAELARYATEGSIRAWQEDCEKRRADARAPFQRFAACAGNAIPRRYADARPPVQADDPEHESVREILRQRLKSRVAYRAATEAAIGIAEGRVKQVLLAGPSGGGKSTLVAVMLRALAGYFADRWEAALGALPSQPGPVSPDVFLYRPPPPAPKAEVLTQRRARGLEPPASGRHESASGKPDGWRRLACQPGYRLSEPGQESPVHWVTARDAFRAAANPPRPKFGEDPRDPLEVWKKAPLLVLDDIGGEPEQRNIEAVDGILWHRHDADDDLVTIATTGFCDERMAPKSPEGMTEEQVLAFLAPLTQRYGAALVRRIAEPGQVVVIPVLATRAAGKQAA